MRTAGSELHGRRVHLGVGGVWCGHVTIRRLLYAKELTFKGKDGSTSIFRNLTNGSAWADTENNVSRTGTSGSKGESMTTATETGAKDTGSDGYGRSDKEGGG